jgi:hypothetical protein
MHGEMVRVAWSRILMVTVFELRSVIGKIAFGERSADFLE